MVGIHEYHGLEFSWCRYLQTRSKCNINQETTVLVKSALPWPRSILLVFQGYCNVDCLCHNEYRISWDTWQLRPLCKTIHNSGPGIGIIWTVRLIDSPRTLELDPTMYFQVTHHVLYHLLNIGNYSISYRV